MPDVPGGALQFSANAADGANSANSNRPRQVVSRVWLNVFTLALEFHSTAPAVQFIQRSRFRDYRHSPALLRAEGRFVRHRAAPGGSARDLVDPRALLRTWPPPPRSPSARRLGTTARARTSGAVDCD